MAYLVGSLRSFAIPGLLLKDAESLVHLRAQLSSFICHTMANDVWLLPTRSVEPVLHLFGTFMVLSGGSCCNMVRHYAHPPPR
jgi:hypothetical protein